MSLVLHERTANDLQIFIARPPHALLLVGADGIGKSSLAEYIMAKILGRDIDNYPYISRIEPDNGTIKIESIKNLKQFLRLMLPTKANGIRRFVIIEHAEAMLAVAQNALLKTLEEPPADTLIILTTSSEQLLLETILSRVQRLDVLAPTRDQLLAHFDEENTARAYMLSAGLPGLMTSILNDDANELTVTAETARNVLTTTSFDRLKLIDKLAKKPDQVPSLISVIGQMARTALESGARRDTVSIRRWHNVLKSVDDAESALAHNAQTKLVLLNFFLNI